MLPFCGYNMGDYFRHWIDMGRMTDEEKLPKIFYVNWFRKERGHFLWPGFRESSRVLKWIHERCEGKGKGVETPIGFLPTKEALDLEGLDLEKGALDKLLYIDRKAWLFELEDLEEYFKPFGNHFPLEFLNQIKILRSHLK